MILHTYTVCQQRIEGWKQIDEVSLVYFSIKGESTRAMLQLLTPAFKLGSIQPLQKALTKRLLVTLVPEQTRVQLVPNTIQQRFSSTYSFNMNSKHLATGSAFPANQEGKLRIYSMRFCPYAQRALLVAEAKGIAHDIVNCHLKQKAEWLLEKNPAGKVPTIDTPKGPLYESLIVADYLDEVYPGRALNAADPFQRALDRIWIENFSKVPTLLHKLLVGRTDEELVKGLFVELAQALAPFEVELKRRGTLFFGGSAQPGMIDYMIWPWFERLPMLKLYFPTLYDFEAAKLQNPTLEKFRQAMKADKAVDTFIISADNHYKFVQNFLAGTTDYDNYDFSAK